jgi:SAM-dependent methyltransferase
MTLLCPTCRTAIDPAARRCAQGHAFAQEDGVLGLLTAEMARRLAEFEAALRAARPAPPMPPGLEGAFGQLPSGPLAQAHPERRLEWRLRRYDLAVVQRQLTGRGRQRILDVGAWNGWLSHRLAEAGHMVTGIDYFADRDEGLRARRWHGTDWRAFQMDLRDLSVLDEEYDVVILNRCLAFFTDPAAYAAGVKARVAPGGLLLLMGLQFFSAPAEKARGVAAGRRAFQERHGLDLFLFPTRGYLEDTDRAGLEAEGVSVRAYPQLWAANLRARLWRSRPQHAYGVWAKGGNG